MIKFCTEGAGTLFLVLAIGMSTDPITAGLMLVILLYVGYSYGDAHLNPAVSIGAWTLGKDSTSIMLLRMAGQLTGAVGGAYLTFWIALIPYVPEPASSVSVFSFILMELIFSLLFVLLFLCMVYPYSGVVRSVSGIVIGAGFACCLMVVEPLIGFGMHPALNTAFALLDFTQGGVSYTHLPIYLFTPLVAGISAALLYQRLQPMVANPGPGVASD